MAATEGPFTLSVPPQPLAGFGTALIMLPMTHANRDIPESRARGWILTLLLSALCLIFRAPALLALPIFGDESIYLRWSQLVLPRGGGHWWVSLCDPKPPLHFWLIAVALKCIRDPLAAGRMVSVLVGVLSVPAIILAADELSHLARSDRPAISGRALGLLAAILLIFCPFLAFYQRLATADALFVLEMLAATWLALRWARRVTTGRGAWPAAVALGVVMGCSLLTRQGLSYTLWGLPPAALVLHLLRNRAVLGPAAPPPGKRPLSIAIPQLLLVILIGAALWSPYLLAHLQSSAAENGGIVAELKRRILYQAQFTTGDTSRAQIARRNFLETFVPAKGTRDASGIVVPPEAGWLFLYMTPGIYVAGLLGLLYLCLMRQWNILLLLALWLALMLGPPIILGNVIYSRYVLPGAAALLLAAACLLEGVMAWIFSRRMPPWLAWTLAAAVFAVLLIPPLRQIGIQAQHWSDQLLTARDRYQYVEGWNAGLPTQRAIETLRQSAKNGPLVLLTDWRDGNPADAAWAFLANTPNITLYYTMPTPQTPMILTPAPAAPPGTFLLRRGKYLFTPPQPIAILQTMPVFYITNDPVYVSNTAVPAEEFFRAKNPSLGPPMTFYGVGGRDAPAGQDRVLVFPVQ